jgi:hypothetical protein
MGKETKRPATRVNSQREKRFRCVPPSPNWSRSHTDFVAARDRTPGIINVGGAFGGAACSCCCWGGSSVATGVEDARIVHRRELRGDRLGCWSLRRRWRS